MLQVLDSTNIFTEEAHFVSRQRLWVSGVLPFKSKLDLMDTAATAAVYLLFATLAVVCVGTSAMAFILRRRFPDMWSAWGEPVQWLWLLPSRVGDHVLSFLDSKAYRSTGDVGFVRFCEMLRLGWFFVLSLFVVALVLLGLALAAR